jgi:3-hydroxybutyryl-CoA dehydratase
MLFSALQAIDQMAIVATDSGSFYVSVGDRVSFSKTVSETDVYCFAGMTGDLAPLHVQQPFAVQSAYGQRIAPGALMVGFMSTTSSLMVDKAKDSHSKGETPVSVGYDRIRFLGAVFLATPSQSTTRSPM